MIYVAAALTLLVLLVTWILASVTDGAWWAIGIFWGVAAVSALIGGLLIYGVGAAQAEPGHRDPIDTCRKPGYSWGPGDDNCDGTITRDEAGWDCRTMGNNVCPPNNPQGVPPGDYSPWDEGGMNVEGWTTPDGLR